MKRLSKMRICIPTFLALAALVLTSVVYAPQANAQGNLEQERWRRQVTYLESAIQREPSVPLGYMRMAQAYAQMGREREVLQYVGQAVQLGANQLAADILVGDFYQKQGRPDQAIPAYMRVLQYSPRQAHVLTQLWILMQRTRTEGKRLSIDPTQIINLLNSSGYFIAIQTPTGNVAAAAGQLQQGNQMLNNNNTLGAIQAYQAAATHDPWNPEIYRGLGIAYAKGQDPGSALGSYHLYVALANPRSPDVPKVRSIILNFYKTNR